MNEIFANIALDLPLDTLFTYKIPDHLREHASPGKRALVNFGGKSLTGIITSLTGISSVKNVKSILSILDEERIIPDELLRFSEWVSGYYVSPVGEVLFSSIPRKINFNSDNYYFLNEDYKVKLDALKEKDEVLIDILAFIEKNKRTGLTNKQIERRLKATDTLKYLAKLTDSGVLRKEKYYSKPTQEKFIKIARKNFSDSELSHLITKHKIKSLNQIKALEILAGVESYHVSALMKETGVTSQALNTLMKKEVIIVNEVRLHRDSGDIFTEDHKEIMLNNEQHEALKKINEAVDEKIFKTFLLHGVTGSGKTEVYINAVKNVLEKEKTAIVMVPEISLTPQLIHRFRRIFGNKVGIIHSRLSDGEKLDTYERIINGTFKIVIGARSALFAPLKNIGMIIADEEHDSSYKQENSPRYNGRDAAIYRAMLNDAVIVLGSATPSVESYYNAITGKYELLNLRSRVSETSMPDIRIIDLQNRQQPDEEQKDFFDMIDKVRIRFLSKELIYEIGERLAKKESIIILQNRRGYHSYSECLNCGNVEMCNRCSISLTYHKIFDLLKCHYCGYTRKFTKLCSQCGSKNVIPKGAGTERVEEELQKIFPLANIKRMDSDTLTSRKQYQQILKDFYDKKIDILTGTQIISKGLDFPHVTLVGVVNADIGLLNPDFRATERTFQILTQVSGRSGRSRNKGEVLIQTNHADFSVFTDVKNHDYNTYFSNELKVRRQLNYPPFSRLSIIETRSVDKNLAEAKIKEIYNLIKELDADKKLDLLPPNVPLFSKLKDKYRFHLLIKSLKEKDPSGKYMNDILHEAKNYVSVNIPKKVMVTFDVDPVNLL